MNKRSGSRQMSSIMEEEVNDAAMDAGPEQSFFEVKEASCWDQIFLNRAIRAGFGILFFGLLLPLLVYIFMSMSTSNMSGRSCAIYEDYKIECMAGKSPSASQCRNAGCCWNATEKPHCYHSLPSYHNYLEKSSSDDGMDISLSPLVSTSPVGTKMHPIHVRTSTVSREHLSFLFYDQGRYAGEFPPDSGIKLSQTPFEVRTFGSSDGKPPFSLEVLDRNESTLLLGTAEGPLVASDRYWMISLKLPTAEVFGWGGAGVQGLSPPTLKLPRGPLALWAGGGRRLAHPFLLCLSDTGRAHGVFFSANGPLEAVLLSSGLLTLRAVITVSMEMHVLAGPTPYDVSRQVAEWFGHPALPPYWALGLHTCRNDSANAHAFFQRAEASGLPFDTDCLGLHALSRKSFEVEQNLLNATKVAREFLISTGRRFISVQRPQIDINDSPAYNEGVDKDLFVKFGLGTGHPFLGTFDGRPVAYPGLLQAKTQEWLEHLIAKMESNLTAAIPGFVVEDDSPLSTANFGKNPFPSDDLAFVPRGLNKSISQGTLWWMSRHSETVLHYQIHNSYGYLFGQILSQALSQTNQQINQGGPGSRALILGEWTHPGTGTFGGHGGAVGVNRTWTAMWSAFVTTMANGLVGIPLSAGTAACGRPLEEDSKGSKPFESPLCRRWIKLGSLLPLWRVYFPPGNLSDGMMLTLVSAARLRYSLLPYIYTQMYNASTTGLPVARHLLFDYPDSELARNADDQLLLGPALMVTPSFLPNTPAVTIFLPNATWYRYPGGERMKFVGRKVTYMLTRDDTPVFVKGGYVIPMQDPATSATTSRRNPLSLLVSLNCDPHSKTPCAEGDLFLDDGESVGTLTSGNYDLLKFVALTERSLVVKRTTSWLRCPGNPLLSTVLDSITVFGAVQPVSGVVVVDGVTAKNASAGYADPEGYVVRVTNIGADWCGTAGGGYELTIEWM